ncbi:MAG: tetraacyldisaccharide 4'-kinase [Sulfuricurvum sp. PD_MW2]|uniref:tetraacyldisaccharide 4'-kinase n=1 Tax=Sulfuricurvum sp. PD_MW2 TaxID=2027917 RepID=UPI000C05EF2D|nr:tetraacyldisaccharide 4'-kinase [Sulfuricurvum sp. PD_MW2]PHM17583.1 MAG: tetraacyldisaccharide 4'-kinase [Sulfuricurvum sp. PD_MW2]
MKRYFVQWGERYLYNPSLIQKILSILLLPISWLYCLLAYIRYLRSSPKSQGIPVVSVGNLTVGGTGKTPVVIELARHFDKPAIVLRGYGRKSKGMVVVKDKTTILCDVIRSGDEAMLYAESLPSATVIVSEIRERGIAEAKAMGCDVILLDDGYGKHSIEKLDLVIAVPTPNPFCLPSGAYRERLWFGKKATILMERVAFQRSVSIKNPTEKMVLVTAIARPERLDPYLPEGIEKIYFEDHHFFTQGELESIIKQYDATSLLVTSKDFVKMSMFKLNLSLLDLSVVLDETLISTVKEYVHAKKD